VLDPTVLAYVMAPITLVLILFLMRFNVAVREPVWLWCLVFLALIVSNRGIDVLYSRTPNPRLLHARIAVPVVCVTFVIYLTGWGPVLLEAYALVALESMALGGSRVWRISAAWSMAGILAGQVAIAEGWAPSRIAVGEGNAMAVMGAFILFFIIRMAAATVEQREEAESSMRISEDRFRSLIQNSRDATIVMDETGVCTFVSPAIVHLVGLEPKDLLGRAATDFVHPDDRDRLAERLGSQFEQAHSTVLVQFRMARSDSRWREVEAVVTDQRDRPSVAGFVANVRDITERKEFESLLAHRALHDPLTGLANRQLILDRAEQMLVRCRRACEPVAALFIDLDNFKDANDSLGHEAGDHLLQGVAHRISAMLRAGDTVGRLGGDEFVILTEGASLAAGPLLVADRIREVLREPFRIPGFEDLPVTVSASIGIATGDRPTAQDLLRDADTALYRAKATGRDCYALFEPAMQSAALDRLELKSDLASALDRDQFFLLYQPIFDLGSERVRGVEALLRWQHPTRGVIPPDDFIYLLEDTGMIVEVGRWVLDQACAQAAEWQGQGYRASMSVNVSMRQLETDVLVGHVTSALAASGLDPASLVVEVTESTLMRDADATVSRLQALKEIGVMIAIDDFGTGYSSLAYLRRFPVDVLKIDRSFVAEMDGSADATALIRTLVELGRALGIMTLAEGIEETAQLEVLRREQCDSGQGFIFSRPVEPEAIDALLRIPEHTPLARSPVDHG
jgi:diguanylate cyclase (GGDEF)-like protein/PAS domain S-box-containing protein